MLQRHRTSAGSPWIRRRAEDARCCRQHSRRGLDEMLTANRLGLPAKLRRSLACKRSRRLRTDRASVRIAKTKIRDVRPIKFPEPCLCTGPVRGVRLVNRFADVLEFRCDPPQHRFLDAESIRMCGTPISAQMAKKSKGFGRRCKAPENKTTSKNVTSRRRRPEQLHWPKCSPRSQLRSGDCDG
jgi:hypothetical protein